MQLHRGQTEEQDLSSTKERLAKTEGEPQSYLKEIETLKNKLECAIKAEANNKKAMDDLALALKEVAAEASQAKQNLSAARDEVQHYKKESEELKDALKVLDEKHKTLLEQANNEADLQRNIADRFRLEAEDTLQAWNGKETGLVDCIRRVEDEKVAVIEENTKLLEALTVAENMYKTAKQENQKLRDILKQALNEANVAKEAAGIARSENSQLKDVIAEKDDALVFITRENENLRINEVATLEQIKGLKRLLSESPEEHEKHVKSQSSTDKEPKQRKLSNAFSFNLKDLITYPDEGEAGLNPDELEHVDGAHSDEAESERNSKKKRALLRRFGDIIIRRKGGIHRRESSNGGEIQKKETLAATGDTQINKEAFAELAA